MREMIKVFLFINQEILLCIKDAKNTLETIIDLKRK